MKYSVLLCIFFNLIFLVPAGAQNGSGNLLREAWNASWIKVPGEPKAGYGVYIFRKSFLVKDNDGKLLVHVSADNRYKLYVNESLVSLGPARGDPDHWNYESVDISTFIHKGENVIAAIVWNEGAWRAEGQISLQTGFILQADNALYQDLNTGNGWKCTRDSAFHVLPFDIPAYYVAGPGETVDMKYRAGDWKKTSFSDSNWKFAEKISAGMPKGFIGGYGTESDWLLLPSSIPAMELTLQRLARLKSSEGVEVPAGFPSSAKSFIIPANTTATILLDQGFLTNAYPDLIFSGGKSASISIGYAEALFTKYPSKGNRNETSGKLFTGRMDSILSNGSEDQSFIPLSFRTYRYVQIKLITKNEPLLVRDFFGTATGYPFKMNARLESDNPEMDTILKIGWRTARNCAMETYMDCPYYEQLQYIGDARIQALVSFYNSGDERLLRNAMNEMDNSRRPEGVTLSRHPSYTPQYIPTFSLWYIGMLHDYMMYGRDSSFIINKLPGERQILNYFRNYQQADGSLEGVPYWMFTDWVERKGWESGRGPLGQQGESALIDLQLLWAYQLAADLEFRYGMKSFSTLYRKYAEQLKKMIRRKYFDSERKLFADRPEKDLFSQHSNALAILTGIVTGNEANTIARKILADSSLAPASIYFKYYLHEALVKAGLGNDYLKWLDQWRENIKMGLTTWAEISDINNARSDCHAWGSSPNIEFYRTVLGIDSDIPGFTRIKVEPHLGSLKFIQGEIPHPMGKISAAYRFENGKWNIRIFLPQHTTGSFIWKSQSRPLKQGENVFSL